MTKEQFERASEIKEEINQLHDIKDAIINSSEDNPLVTHQGDECGRVMNVGFFPAATKQSVITVIEKDIATLELEFESL